MSAAEMREAAAKEAESATYAKVSLCCNGRECGCQGASVGEYVAHLIRALPLPDEEGMVEALNYAKRMCELDLRRQIDGDSDEFNQAIYDTYQRICRAINGGEP